MRDTDNTDSSGGDKYEESRGQTERSEGEIEVSTGEKVDGDKRVQAGEECSDFFHAIKPHSCLQLSLLQTVLGENSMTD